MEIRLCNVFYRKKQNQMSAKQALTVLETLKNKLLGCFAPETLLGKNLNTTQPHPVWETSHKRIWFFFFFFSHYSSFSQNWEMIKIASSFLFDTDSDTAMWSLCELWTDNRLLWWNGTKNGQSFSQLRPFLLINLKLSLSFKELDEKKCW